jgi:hypothetical protein
MSRSLRAFIAIILTSGGLLFGQVAYAQESLPAPRLDIRQQLQAALPAASYAMRLADTAADEQSLARPRIVNPRPTSSTWKSALFAMDAMTVSMQLADYDSTVKVLNLGGVEANPIMAGIVKNRGVFLGAKLGIAAGLVYATHNMAKQNKVAALLASVAANTAYAYISQRNYRLARSVTRTPKQ